MNIEELRNMENEVSLSTRDLPIHPSVIESLTRWSESGILPGGFLTACLENDLIGAMGRADIYNRATLFQICQYMYNELPHLCHGSPERVSSWERQFMLVNQNMLDGDE